jgi:ribosome maturation factor RimP
MSLRDKVTKLIDEALESRPDIFILDFDISDANDIHLTIDGDHGVTIDDIVFFSRQIEHNLDRDEEDFSLTVSSFDITKPFHLKRQFKKNIGRKIKVKTTEGEKEGTLMSVDDDQIVLENKVREPKKIGKGKVTVTKQDTIPFEQIKDAKVVLKF